MKSGSLIAAGFFLHVFIAQYFGLYKHQRASALIGLGVREGNATVSDTRQELASCWV